MVQIAEGGSKHDQDRGGIEGGQHEVKPFRRAKQCRPAGGA